MAELLNCEIGDVGEIGCILSFGEVLFGCLGVSGLVIEDGLPFDAER